MFIALARGERNEDTKIKRGFGVPGISVCFYALRADDQSGRGVVS